MVTELQVPTIEFRVLTGDEARLVDPEGIAWPASAAVVFAIENNRIVGRSAILGADIVEGTWTSPEKRGTSLAFRLIRRVEELYKAHGRTHAIAFVSTEQPEVAGYLERAGYEKSPLMVYSKVLVKVD